MESQRNILIVGLLFISFLLYMEWQDANKPPQPVTQPTAVANDAATTNNLVPTSTAVASQADLNPQADRQIITITSDLLKLSIDTLGGDIVESKLLEYPVEMNGAEDLNLLEKLPNYTYVAKSGLIGANGPDDATQESRPLYSSAKQSYVLDAGQDSIDVVLSYTDAQGIEFEKVFTVKRDAYNVDVSYRVKNTSSQNILVQLWGQLTQSVVKPTEESSFFMQLYRGAAFSTEQDKYEKYDFSDMDDANLKQITQGGWVAMIQHYFVTAWVPASDQENRLYTSLTGDKELGSIGFMGQPTTIAPNTTQEFKATLYTGPKLQDRLEAVSPTLYLTVDYGFLWWLASPLHALLTLFYTAVGNWGVAIVMLTLAVRGSMYWLTKKQYTSMAKMRQLAPKMAALKERYGDDRQKMGQATMELYRKEKVNPLGGCLPLLLQMPIFLGLFWMLQESVELRHAPFMFWITDLSVKDPYYVLPILMGASMWYMSKLQPSMSADPMQQKMMQIMPIIFTVFFLWFPSGLVLYWVVSNIVTLLQQTYIYRQIDNEEAKAGKK
ncbi:membrane protein insertase YidC [Psychrobium sp. MM17-31]|uniref:membrane protein insertase YidC n=1 Tax=Psychrobium sp. MM17-31 TaxID=2917758 RepID=UPI001EF6D1E0|nr:membrane protein insertase YidC [Psychrobium sp. MM17-31]MCG7532906.1 membrane protein insertase YidC [Psychrobium sp. MM17-31]